MSTNPPPASDATPTPGECWCETCRPNTMLESRMILCPVCGNKRCPRATHHDNACTGSNEPGQRGSSWENYPTPGAVGAGDELAVPFTFDPARCNHMGKAAIDCPHCLRHRIGDLEAACAHYRQGLEMIAKIEHVDHESVAAHANSVLRLCDDGALLLGRFRYQCERAERAVAERDTLRAAVEKIPDIIRKSGEPGPGGIDITSGIPSVVYVGIGREHYADDYELARETAEYTRDEAAGAVEVFIRAALADGRGRERLAGAGIEILRTGVPNEDRHARNV
jgi:hypothetical protein